MDRCQRETKSDSFEFTSSALTMMMSVRVLVCASAVHACIRPQDKSIRSKFRLRCMLFLLRRKFWFAAADVGEIDVNAGKN